RASVAALALLIVLPGNVFEVELAPANPDRGLGASYAFPAWRVAESIRSPDSDLVMWTEALTWMRHNTPDAGVDLGRVVEAPAPGEAYAQAPESYGVLSWWDYGHWTEVVARRAPVANPFQQAAPFASCWFTERDPARAEAMLAEWSARRYARTTDVRCDDVVLPPAPEPSPDAENPIRYVVIDDAMAAGKFGAITVWAGCDVCIPYNRSGGDQRFANRDQYNHAVFQFWRTYREADTGIDRSLPWSGEAYRDTMLSRLYFDDGDGLDRYRLVHELPYGRRIGWVAGLGDDGLYSHNQNDFLSNAQGACPPGVRAGDCWAAEDWTHTGAFAFRTGDERLLYESQVVSTVKTYEHVVGAVVEGTGAPPGAAVHATIRLRSDTTLREFEWTATAVADAQGAFRLRVPYATTGHLSPAEGGTNLTVRAVGPLHLFVGASASPSHGADVDVPDAAVLQGQRVGTVLLGL
ncbi:MAG TPA: hypothetical protein VHH36_03555, partial [Candidatus Thermoplasmatota archaeon]|nr:hypothetical protein [Candidatus Thermoplasmatota archaeon]